MSDKALDEARRQFLVDMEFALDCKVMQHGHLAKRALASLIAAERADAERAQRDVIDNLTYAANIHKAEARAQRERTDGLERKLAEAREWRDTWKQRAKACDGERRAMRENFPKEIESATRPYRMAIARWWTAMQQYDMKQREDAEANLRESITDADIEAARKENPDVR